MEIGYGSRRFVVGQEVGQTPKYNLYEVQEIVSGSVSGPECLLQIAVDLGQNGALDRAAFVLNHLKEKATETEKDYEAVNPKGFLNYDLGFPKVVDSFICPDQGDRRINILAFRNVERVAQVAPLSNLWKKDLLRVDLRTSAWILGKILKMLTFAHCCCGISVGDLSGDNILIVPGPKQLPKKGEAAHYVILFDWADATIFQDEEVPMEVCRQEIIQASQSIVMALGGDSETGRIPDYGEDGYGPYSSFMRKLFFGGEINAEKGHREFYDLVRSLWKREFWPFTTFPRDKETAE